MRASAKEAAPRIAHDATSAETAGPPVAVLAIGFAILVLALGTGFLFYRRGLP